MNFLHGRLPSVRDVIASVKERSKHWFLSLRNAMSLASSLLLADVISFSSEWKILTAMLLSQFVIEVERDTFVVQLCRGHESGV